MCHVRMDDGFIRSTIDIKGKPNKYGKPKEEAEKWIKKHSYNSMSYKYEIYEDTLTR